MKVSGMLWAGLVALSMAGCATRGPAVDSPALRDPEALAAAQAGQATRAAWLAAQSDWSFAGRVAVNANGKGGSGRLDWQQTGATYRVALSAPITRQSWRLSGDLPTGAARLEGLEGGPREGVDADRLLREATGWDIPVASMVHWARGVVDPATPAEVRERTVQTRDRATQQGETRAGQLGGGFEIQPAVFFAQSDMILDREIEAARRTPARDLDVALFVVTHRHRLVRQVGDIQQQVVEFALDAVELTLALLQLTAHAVDIGQQRRNVFTSCLGLTNGLGATVALGLQLFGTGLDRLALRFERLETRYIQLKTAASKALGHIVKLAANQFGVEHVQVSIQVQKIAWQSHVVRWRAV
mgnify:CR=1 FL=1